MNIETENFFLNFISPERVIFLNENSRDDALKALVEVSKPLLKNHMAFLDSLIYREDIMSTGMGFEIAFPHSKNLNVKDFFVTIGISPAGLNWNSFDGKPVKLIFLIGGLFEEQEKYLKILSSLSKVLQKREIRARLLETKDAGEFYRIFKTVNFNIF